MNIKPVFLWYFFINRWLTLYYNDDNISSMQSSNYSVYSDENLPLIYSGLNSISDKGRKRLKNIAKSLIAIQNRPGTPVPDSIGREIMRDCTNELL